MRLILVAAALWSLQYEGDHTPPGPRGMVPGHYRPAPVRVLCRWLLRHAVFEGYITRPPGKEFHHPDYRRPFYGVWLTPFQHARVHLGWMRCPAPHDYAKEVLCGSSS